MQPGPDLMPNIIQKIFNDHRDRIIESVETTNTLSKLKARKNQLENALKSVAGASAKPYQEELDAINKTIEHIQSGGDVDGTNAGLGFTDEGVGEGAGTQATGTGATNDTDDTTTDETETETPMTLNTMSLTDILADEDLQKLL